MESSLSVLFPVHNAQASLHDDIHRMLEVLPELSRRFELLIIDDGSNDATFEVAQDLTLCFPQIKVVRHAQPLGLAESLRNGLNRTSGEMILVRDQHGGAELDELARLWRHRLDTTGVIQPPRARTSGTKGWFRRWLPAHNHAAMRPTPRRTSGFHLLQRSALRQMQLAGQAPLNTPSASEPSRGSGARPGALRTDAARQSHDTQRPNFLQKVRDFAVGE